MIRSLYLAALSLWLLPGSTVAATSHFAITETASGLTLEAEGAFDLTGLDFFGFSANPAEVAISVPQTAVGFGPGDLNLFGVVTDIPVGDGPFGTGDAELIEPFSTGDAIAFSASVEVIPGMFLSLVYVPINYQDGTPLSNKTTFDGQTLAGLGLNEGVYHYGVGRNDITLTIASAVPVPLPAGGWLLLSAMGAGLAAARGMRPGRE